MDDQLSQKEFDKVFEKIYDQSQRPNFFFKNTIHHFYSRSGDQKMNKTEKEPAKPEITVAESCKKKHWSGLFDLIDENGDGVLSWHEFLNDSRIKNCSDLMAKVNTFTNADTDRDGKVTKKEFITYMSE